MSGEHAWNVISIDTADQWLQFGLGAALVLAGITARDSRATQQLRDPG